MSDSVTEEEPDRSPGEKFFRLIFGYIGCGVISIPLFPLYWFLVSQEDFPLSDYYTLVVTNQEVLNHTLKLALSPIGAFVGFLVSMPRA